MDTYTAALDLLRRLPPTNVQRNVDILCQLIPDLASDLLLEVDQPLRVAKDPENGREYLCSEYNRDSDSWRSPWTNAYDPPLADGAVPSKKLRELEVAMNDAFDTYRDMLVHPSAIRHTTLTKHSSLGTTKAVSRPCTSGTKKTAASRASFSSRRASLTSTEIQGPSTDILPDAQHPSPLNQATTAHGTRSIPSKYTSGAGKRNTRSSVRPCSGSATKRLRQRARARKRVSR